MRERAGRYVRAGALDLLPGQIDAGYVVLLRDPYGMLRDEDAGRNAGPTAQVEDR
jgi:hypothetical protein